MTDDQAVPNLAANLRNALKAAMTVTGDQAVPLPPDARRWPYDGMEGRARLTGNACYPSVAGGEAKATPYVHRDCGGPVITSLDGDLCGLCGTELVEEDWATEAVPQPLGIPADVLTNLVETNARLLAANGGQSVAFKDGTP